MYFVRHGEAASSWDKASDPGLSDLGHRQASLAAEAIERMTAPVEIFSSPLCRARETAMPLEKKWGKSAEISTQVAEIPSGKISFDERHNWLMQIMQSQWSKQSDILLNWRADILNVIRTQQRDAVFFTHFMVINTIVAAIEERDDILCFRPDNGSITRISVEQEQIKLIDRGQEAITKVQ